MPFIGNQPAKVPLTSADITDGIIVNADINANAAIASSKLSITSPLSITGNSTAGSEIRLPEDTDNGSNYVALKAADSIASNLTFTLPSADGSANQVLQTNGSGTLSFASVSSDYVLLATTTASDSASVSFDGYFSSTYTNYQIHFYNLDFSTQTDLLVRFRIANADVTSSNYKYGTLSNPYFDENGSGNGTQINNSWSSTHIKLNNNDLGTGVGDYVTQGILYLQNPLSASNYKMCMGDFAYMATALNIMKRESFVGSLQSATTALSGITFYPGAGNIVTGIFKLYGIK